jgi:predicted DNA-binding transcriptional regulator YafY
MPSNHETLLRQWQMLRWIPRYPGKITATQIKGKLDAEDFVVTKRTVERDLNDLSLAFPLCVDDRSRPHGWSWQKDAPAFDLPGLGNNEALTMMMVEQHLTTLLPAATLDVLAPNFKAARQHLTAIPKSRHIRSWLNKVRTVPPSQPLLSPKIKPEVQHAVSEALLADLQLEISYRRRGETKPVDYRIHPLALIQRGGIIYLYVRIFNYEDTRMLVMHRIESAMLLDESTEYPEGFNIDDEVNKGRFGFGEGNMLQLQAIFSPESGEHLYETSLSKDQKIEEQSDGSLKITATVADTAQLRWWLLALGAGVEVIEPISLREEIAGIARSMMAKYQ